jgi:mono/diheme cytochrome c family protein
MESLIKMRCLLAFAPLLFSCLTHSASAADLAHGEAVVKRWCAGCHLVGPGQTSSTEAPPFSAIAKRPDFDAAKIAFFLLDPHPKMPNMQLTRAEAADIAAYIATLK